MSLNVVKYIEEVIKDIIQFNCSTIHHFHRTRVSVLQIKLNEDELEKYIKALEERVKARVFRKVKNENAGVCGSSESQYYYEKKGINRNNIEGCLAIYPDFLTEIKLDITKEGMNKLIEAKGIKDLYDSNASQTIEQELKFLVMDLLQPEISIISGLDRDDTEIKKE